MNEDSVNTIVHQILDEANKHQGNEPTQDYIAALNACGSVSVEEREKIRVTVAQSLSTVKSASGAGFIGIWLGGAVENGVDPDLFIPYLYPHFLQMMKRLSIVDEELEETSENEELKIGLQYLGQALVAHLSRSQKKRDEIANDEDTMRLIEDMSAYSIGVTWLFELLIKHSDDLVVLHATEAIGVRVRYKNLSNCFHLFTLLQTAIADVMPHEEEDFEDDDDDDKLSYYAWWHYGQGNDPEANIVSSIWGEMPPSGISIIEGERIMLLWPTIMASRSWDDGFFHPVLEAAPASVELLETLSDKDVATWRKRLKLK